MNILHTSEFYSPSVGGAQEVVKQISERLAARGHNVTVATTYLSNRQSEMINGVKVVGFNISGNEVNGMKGEVERYQEFLINNNFDIMMNYAAQQWTMDAVFPVIDLLHYKKVMIPCGFSGLFDPNYESYFSKLPSVMDKYDHLVFHANNYRDINFAREHGFSHFSVIPNGAARDEFNARVIDFREKYKISNESPILLTVGSHTGTKGHGLILEAFEKIKTRNAVLIIIGNIFSKNSFKDLFIKPLASSIRHLKIRSIVRLFLNVIQGRMGTGCLPDCKQKTKQINSKKIDGKRVFLIDPPRAEVISAYQAADLFVFGSNIEYSPLVLFEATASHTPFISLNCGNASEIVEWTGGGLIAPSKTQQNGFIEGDSDTFSEIIDDLLCNPEKRRKMAETGYQSWLKKYTWEHIALEYENLYMELIKWKTLNNYYR